MKNILKSTFSLLVLLFAFPGLAQDTYKFKEGKMTISGTSSLHDWVSDVTQLEWSGTVVFVNNDLSGIKNAVVKIPVKSIKSTKGRIMDSKTYEAFNAEKNPYITFKAIECQISETTITVSGTLTMAGNSRKTELTIKYKQTSNGNLQLMGSSKINMKDYGMESPTAMMGAIKVGEEVTVDFDITIIKSNSK
jgi:polyisoprenoid-binding protein YceI